MLGRDSHAIAVWAVASLVLLRGVGWAVGLFEVTTTDYVASTFGLPYLVASWARADARRTGYWPAFHYGAWLMVAWPIAVPHYVLRTRGRSGVLLAVALLVAICAGAVGWAIAVGVGLLLGVYSPS